MRFCISKHKLDSDLILIDENYGFKIYLDKSLVNYYNDKLMMRGYSLPHSVDLQREFNSDQPIGGNFLAIDSSSNCVNVLSSIFKDHDWFGDEHTLTNHVDIASNLSLSRLSSRTSRARAEMGLIIYKEDDIHTFINRVTLDSREIIEQNIQEIYKQTGCCTGVFTGGRDTGVINVLARKFIKTILVDAIDWKSLKSTQKEYLSSLHSVVVHNGNRFTDMNLPPWEVTKKSDYHRRMFYAPGVQYVYTGLFGEFCLIPHLRYIESLCARENYFPKRIPYLERYHTSGDILHPIRGNSPTAIFLDIVDAAISARLISYHEDLLWCDPFRDLRLLKRFIGSNAKTIIDNYNSMEPYQSIICHHDTYWFDNMIYTVKNRRLEIN